MDAAAAGNGAGDPVEPHHEQVIRCSVGCRSCFVVVVVAVVVLILLVSTLWPHSSPTTTISTSAAAAPTAIITMTHCYTEALVIIIITGGILHPLPTLFSPHSVTLSLSPSFTAP